LGGRTFRPGSYLLVHIYKNTGGKEEIGEKLSCLRGEFLNSVIGRVRWNK